MPLEAIPAEAGLWINPDYPAGGPGVHALIIGVSRYDHLNGGILPAPDAYGLGQLSVSALTAYRFFHWLSNAYALDGWPIVRIRLLMSPQRKGIGNATSDELEGCDAAILAHAPEATFGNCQRALENWYADMQALQAPASGRSLFLFSGHGIERRQNYQLLLPSDYLRPPVWTPSNAISTPNVTDALSYLARVSSHVLLLDGCRNDIEKLRGASGARILDDNQGIEANPLFEKGVLYATASGLRAYSPKSGGLSLFGQALLDGLSNRPDPHLGELPIELTHRGQVGTIEINKLASYITRRVAALIEAANESVVQVMRSEVFSPDPDRPIELAQIPLRTLEIKGGPFSVETPRSLPRNDGTTPPAPAPDAWFNQRYQAPQKAEVAAPGASRHEHVDRFHTIFGSEAVTYPWLDKLQIIGLSTHQTFGHAAVELLSSAQAHKTQQLHRLQIRFRLASDDPVGHLMVIEDDRGRRLCCVVPSDTEKRIFDLEIDVEGGDYINFASYLSPHNDGPAGRIATAWEQLRAIDPLAATRQLESSKAEEALTQEFAESESALRTKIQSPLAATVAAVLLLKANQFDRMHDWARNLADWFPDIPDGVVLWTEQCRRMAAGRPLDPDLIPQFVRKLSRRGLPFTADGFGLAADLVDQILRGRLKTDAATRTRARALEKRLDAAAPFFLDTGMFCTFADFPATWNPALILGPPPPPPMRAAG